MEPNRYGRAAPKPGQAHCVALVYNERCFQPAESGYDDLPFCMEHFLQAVEYFTRLIMGKDVRRRLLAEPAHPELAPTFVVYYLQRWDDMIKIGYSGNLRQRRATLQGEHGPLDLLAVEAGAGDVEARRHLEFAPFRQGNTEWFAPDETLLAHIAELARLRLAA